jgi:hypothetical protein
VCLIAMPSPPCPKTRIPAGLEVRYARSFLLDIEGLEADARHQVLRFIFEDFYSVHPLHELPEFHQLSANSIFYRFTFDQYLIGLEMTGQLVKFLRILPKPNLESAI